LGQGTSRLGLALVAATPLAVLAAMSVPAAPASAAVRVLAVTSRLTTAAPLPAEVYVANSASKTVTPISLSSGLPGKALSVGSQPRAVAITPNGSTIYVVNEASKTVTPLAAATGKAGKPIKVVPHPTPSPSRRTAPLPTWRTRAARPSRPSRPGLGRSPRRSR
jgi:hypothetical protein